MEKSNASSLIDHRLNLVSQSGPPAAAISSPAAAPKPRLLDRVRQAMRARHLNPRTEDAYIGWIKRFIFFHGKRHPAEMGEAEIGRFLSSLACDSHVAASTQNQALNALLFLYHQVLEKQIGLIRGVVRAKRPRRNCSPTLWRSCRRNIAKRSCCASWRDCLTRKSPRSPEFPWAR